MKKLFSMIAVLTAFTIVATSCDDKTTEEDTIPVTEVKVTPSPASVVAGETVTLKAEVLPENATDKTVTWGTRDASTATVKDGVVTGIKEGEVTIWAKAGEKTKQVTVTVTAAPIRVKTITLNKTELPLFVGKTEKLTYTTDPDNPTYPTAAWTSSVEAVATVADDGTVTALTEGTTTITLTIDEKTATCAVTVSIPEIENISTPYLSELSGTSVQMTAAGFKAGDKVKLESFFGYSSAEIAVTDITATGAKFELPAEATADRSYKLTVMRDGAATAIDYIRAADDMVQMGAALGYALTASNEVVTDGSISSIHGNVVRKGYVTPAAVFSYNETNGTFDASAADLGHCTFATTDGKLELNFVNGVKDLSGMKNFDLSGVIQVWATDSRIEELDMTLFPNATHIYAWGDAGLGEGRFKRVNFGVYGTDPVCKVGHIQLERHQIEGTVDLRNCLYLKSANFNDNQISAFNLGIANTDPSLAIIDLNAKNNKLVELDIANCGQLRKLFLAGNKMERMNILNNTTTASPTGDAMQQYVYLFKSPDCLSIDWATAAEAKGERVINVENYWWRVYSGGNIKENTDNGYSLFENGWLDGNPVVKALADGFKVICWTYNGQGDGTGSAGPAHVIPGHTHEGGSSPCTAL